MSKQLGLVVLAAGQGTRLKIDLPKALAPLLGKALVDYSVQALETFAKNLKADYLISVVVGHQKEFVENHLNSNYENICFAVQKKLDGTASAVRSYFSEIPIAKHTEYTVIMCTDTPLVNASHLKRLFDELSADNKEAVVASFELDNPTGYGRILHHESGLTIREEKDASDQEKQIKEVNSGLYIVKTSYLLQMLEGISSNNKANEFYLTDIFQQGKNVAAIKFDVAEHFQGVNTIAQLRKVSKDLQMSLIEEYEANGVIFDRPESNIIDDGVVIEAGAKISQSVCLYGKTHIGKGAILEQGVIIKDSVVENSALIKAYSYIEQSKIGENAAIGPFAHLRPGADIGPECKIGNFVEIKKSELKKGVKVSHLSYVGDAEIGEETNIGCGFITCNYDGANKHKTTIGKNTFIGSDSQMIAPVTIGDNSYVASGSTINQNIESGGFAIARARQVTKPDLARKFLKTKK